jgi:NifU-like protein
VWNYSQKVYDHFLHPRNVGEIENPSAVAEVGNITCGDALRLTLKIDEHGVITDAKFKTFGCGSAIASASALTELIKGKTLAEARQVSDEVIAEFLGGLPPQKMHCSVMGRDALEAAIANYRGEKAPGPAPDEHIVCNCFGVTDKQIERVAREHNLHTAEEITNYTKAGGGCGGCVPQIEEILARVWGDQPAAPAPPPPTKRHLTNIERIQMVTDVIDKEIRPSLQADGGDIELVDVDGRRVLVRLKGSCSGCAAAGFTLGNFVQQKLRELVAEDLAVEEVPA